MTWSPICAPGTGQNAVLTLFAGTASKSIEQVLKMTCEIFCCVSPLNPVPVARSSDVIEPSNILSEVIELSAIAAFPTAPALILSEVIESSSISGVFTSRSLILGLVTAPLSISLVPTCACAGSQPSNAPIARIIRNRATAVLGCKSCGRFIYTNTEPIAKYRARQDKQIQWTWELYLQQLDLGS